MHDARPALEQVNGRHEALPLQAVAVQVVGRRVRGGDQRGAAREQSVEQPAEDHRIADIADEELVEAQYLRCGRDIRGDAAERVLDVAQRLQARVHLVQHPVEVHTPLTVDVERLVEKVHQEGLAASDTAPDVQACLALVPAAEYPAEQAGTRVATLSEAVLEVGEQTDDGLLRDVALVTLALKAPGVSLANVQVSRYPRRRPGESRAG